MRKLWRYTITVGICFVAAVAMKIYMDRHLEALKATQGETNSEAGR